MKGQKVIPIGGIEPPAAVWETAMLTTTPYRSGLANYAFRFSFDPWGLASCVSCTSVRASISRVHGPPTQPTSKSWQPSIGYLLVIGFGLCCMSHGPNMSYKSRCYICLWPSTTLWLNKLSHVNLWSEAWHTDSTASRKQPCKKALWAQQIIKAEEESTELEGFSRLHQHLQLHLGWMVV